MVVCIFTAIQEIALYSKVFVVSLPVKKSELLGFQTRGY